MPQPSTQTTPDQAWFASPPRTGELRGAGGGRAVELRKTERPPASPEAIGSGILPSERQLSPLYCQAVRQSRTCTFSGQKPGHPVPVTATGLSRAGTTADNNPS